MLAWTRRRTFLLYEPVALLSDNVVEVTRAVAAFVVAETREPGTAKPDQRCGLFARRGLPVTPL